MLFLILMFVLLVILLMLLYLRVMQDKRVRLSRSEMPGKVVLLTGADTQLGEALARSFYGAGCKMVLIGSNRQELERVRGQLFALRPKDVPVYQPEVMSMDTNELEFATPEKAAEIIEICGQVDILINNSMICPRSDILSTSVDDDIRVMNVNYFGPLAFTKAILPHMVTRKSGHIVFISSVAGKVPIPFRSTFAASKHALQAFSDTLRAEIAGQNIQVLVSSPEYISSDVQPNEPLPPASAEKSATAQKSATVPEQTIVPVPNAEVPQKLADNILMSVLRDDSEQMALSFRFAYWLRVTCPPFYHLMMAERARKMFEASRIYQERY